MATVDTQAQLEAELIAQEQATARHTIRVMKALLQGYIDVSEVDLDALRTKVTNLHNLLDGDEATEGYQVFAALTQKLNTVEATGQQNAQAITALQTSLNTLIAEANVRINGVEQESRDGRAALDVRITALSDQYTAHVTAQLIKDADQDTKIADHLVRIEALEAAKILHEARLAQLESDNTAERADIEQLKLLVEAQTTALVTEKTRAEAAEAAIRGELVTERNRVDGLVTQSAFFATRQNVADANSGGAMTYCNTLWAEAGIPMPSGLAMPNGTVSL